jgi:type IV fimbrial biogenesis protein FimT
MSSIRSQSHVPRQCREGIARLRAAGFTLVELMITLAVAAIVLTLAIPSFTSMINTNRLAAMSNDIAGSMQLGRMESVRLGVRVVACPSTDGSTCSVANPMAGWILFTDADNNGTPAAGDVLRYLTVKPPVQFWASPSVATTGRVIFRPDGFAYDNTGTLLTAAFRACLPTTQPAENARDVQLVSGSRVSIAPVNAAGACAAPANP